MGGGRNKGVGQCLECKEIKCKLLSPQFLRGASFECTWFWDLQQSPFHINNGSSLSKLKNCYLRFIPLIGKMA